MYKQLADRNFAYCDVWSGAETWGGGGGGGPPPKFEVGGTGHALVPPNILDLGKGSSGILAGEIEISVYRKVIINVHSISDCSHCSIHRALGGSSLIHYSGTYLTS